MITFGRTESIWPSRKSPAGGHLLRQRITVARRSALHDVADVHLAARDAPSPSRSSVSAARRLRPTKGRPLQVFLFAGALADEHQVGVWDYRRRTRWIGDPSHSWQRVQSPRWSADFLESVGESPQGAEDGSGRLESLVRSPRPRSRGALSVALARPRVSAAGAVVSCADIGRGGNAVEVIHSFVDQLADQLAGIRRSVGSTRLRRRSIAEGRLMVTV